MKSDWVVTTVIYMAVLGWLAFMSLSTAVYIANATAGGFAARRAAGNCQCVGER